MITLHHADALKFLPTIKSSSIDLIVTDPPWKDYHSNIRGADIYDKVNTSGEVWKWIHKFAYECYRVLKIDSHMYCFVDSLYYPMFYTAFKLATTYECEFEDENTPELMIRRLSPTLPDWGFNIKKLLYWLKPSHTAGDLTGDYGERLEPIIFMHKGRKELIGRRRDNLFTFPRVPRSETFHPTQKPIELLKTLILKSSESGETVLDPFAGSCSTGYAAEELGRDSILVELEEEFINKSRFVMGKMNLGFELIEGEK